MKSVYQRANLKITEFGSDDVITTSAPSQPATEPPVLTSKELENAYGRYTYFNRIPGGKWF